MSSGNVIPAPSRPEKRFSRWWLAPPVALALLFLGYCGGAENGSPQSDFAHLDDPSANVLARLRNQIGDVYFTGPETMDPGQEEELQSYIEFLRSNEEFDVEVHGHAHPSGSREQDLDIGESRAGRIATYLAQRGIDPDRIRMINAGGSRPVCPTEDCYLWNNRVELAISRARQQPGEPSWYSWARDLRTGELAVPDGADGSFRGVPVAAQRQRPTPIQVGDTQKLVFDLSSVDYRGVLDSLGFETGGIQVTDSTGEITDALIEAGVETAEAGLEPVRIFVQPVLVGDGLVLGPGQGAARTASIDLDSLRWTNVRPDRRVEEIAALAEMASALRDEYGSWTPIEVEVQGVQEGCAAVALSIWTGGLRPDRPVDYVLHAVKVGDATCLDLPRKPRLDTRLLALYGSQDDLAEAALQVFEMDLGDPKPHSIAVLVIEDPQGGDHESHSWVLGQPLSEYVGAGLQDALTYARNDAGQYFSRTSTSLKEVVFTGAPYGDHVDRGKAAQTSFEAFTRSDQPRFFARLVNSSGESLFLPFGLFEAGPNQAFGEVATIHQPLFEDDFESKPCVAAWTTVIPRTKDHLQDAKEAHLKPLEQALPGETLDWEKFKQDYLRPAEAPESPEGLLVLAHHGDGRMWWDKQLFPTAQYGAISRVFKPGSVAILAACSVGDLRHLELARKLEELGVDAIILAPADVKIRVASRFAIHFAEKVAIAQQAAKPTTLLSLYRQTVEAMGQENSALGAQANEFLIAGNSALALCGTGETG